MQWKTPFIKLADEYGCDKARNVVLYIEGGI
jgi:hypothetical protein